MFFYFFSAFKRILPRLLFEKLHKCLDYQLLEGYATVCVTEEYCLNKWSAAGEQHGTVL